MVMLGAKLLLCAAAAGASDSSTSPAPQLRGAAAPAPAPASADGAPEQPGQEEQQGQAAQLAASAAMPPAGGNMLQWAAADQYCMSVAGNTFGNGAKLQLWTCANGLGQYFQFGDDSGAGTLVRAAAAPDFCVVVDGNEGVNGAKVQLWQCDSGVQAQHWITQGCGMQCPYITLRNAAFPSKCLVVNGNAGYNGNKLQLWDCDGDEALKQWYSAR